MKMNLTLVDCARQGLDNEDRSLLYKERTLEECLQFQTNVKTLHYTGLLSLYFKRVSQGDIHASRFRFFSKKELKAMYRK